MSTEQQVNDIERRNYSRRNPEVDRKADELEGEYFDSRDRLEEYLQAYRNFYGELDGAESFLEQYEQSQGALEGIIECLTRDL